MRYEGILYLLGKIYSIIGYKLYINILLLLCTLLEGQGCRNTSLRKDLRRNLRNDTGFTKTKGAFQV